MSLHESMRADRRRIRAAAFTAMMIQIIGKHLEKFMDDFVEGVEDQRERPDSRDVLRDITYELEDLCRREGIEILTDQMRKDIGLSPRGPDGWTIEEIVAMEKRHLELMRAPIVVQPLALSSPPSKKEGEG